MDAFKTRIDRVDYENMGGASGCVTFPQEGVGYCSEAEARMIRILMGEEGDQREFFGKDGNVKAYVSGAVDDTIMGVRANQEEEEGYCHYHESGCNFAEWLTLICNLPEVDRFCCFDGPDDQDLRLYYYREPEERFPGNFNEATGYRGKTVTFRHYLRRFIRNAKPVRLFDDKNYWLCLDKDGYAVLRLGKKGETIPNLSETEHWVFQYLCNLQMVRFWDGIQKRWGYPFYKKPLLIRDFSDRIDESIDFDRLLGMAEKTGHQVILYR